MAQVVPDQLVIQSALKRTLSCKDSKMCRPIPDSMTYRKRPLCPKDPNYIGIIKNGDQTPTVRSHSGTMQRKWNSKATSQKPDTQGYLMQISDAL